MSALAKPARRALYHYVASQPEPVSRDQAAAGTGLARHAAKFHLDKLVEEGVLVTEFRRLGGRRGPGAGRPSKLYARSGLQLVVTLPPRRYELAGQVLAAAVSTNCPFHSLAEQHRALVCGMNLALLDGLGCHGVAARLDPAPGRCCVTLTRVPGSTAAAD